MRLLCLVLLAVPLRADEPRTITTPSGVKLECLVEGKPGTAPKPGDRVKAHYTGSFGGGKKFMSTLDKGQPLLFVQGGGVVIEGWDEAVALMDAGSKWKIHVPAALAYGAEGNVALGVPANADLDYEIEVLDVAKGIPPPPFPPGDPAKRKTTESGLSWETIEEGRGDLLQGKEVVELRCTVWTTDGKPVFAMGSGRIAGEVGIVCLTPIREAFLPEALIKMREGGKCRLEVPPAICWGSAKVLPRLDASATTVWLVEVTRVVRFAPLDPEKTQKTASGLEYEVIEEGTGKSPGRDSRVAVLYTGWLEANGTEFDSRYRTGKPAVFALNQVIAGWTEGLQLMKEGGICRFRVPADLGYKEKGFRNLIPPNATLIFDVELLFTE